MATSEASIRRQALIDKGLLVLPPKNEKAAAAARKSHEARARNKILRAAGQLVEPANKQPHHVQVHAIESSGETVEKAVASADAIQAQLLPAQNSQSALAVDIQKQNANLLEARKILADAAPKAAEYLAGLVTGSISCSSERIRLEAAKVILSAQGVIGGNSSQQSGNPKDINAMSRSDLMAFVQAGTAELKRIQAERDSQIIDVSDAESD